MTDSLEKYITPKASRYNYSKDNLGKRSYTLIDNIKPIYLYFFENILILVNNKYIVTYRIENDNLVISEKKIFRIDFRDVTDCWFDPVKQHLTIGYLNKKSLAYKNYFISDSGKIEDKVFFKKQCSFFKYKNIPSHSTGYKSSSALQFDLFTNDYPLLSKNGHYIMLLNNKNDFVTKKISISPVSNPNVTIIQFEIALSDTILDFDYKKNSQLIAYSYCSEVEDNLITNELNIYLKIINLNNELILKRWLKRTNNTGNARGIDEYFVQFSPDCDHLFCHFVQEPFFKNGIQSIVIQNIKKTIHTSVFKSNFSANWINKDSIIFYDDLLDELKIFNLPINTLKVEPIKILKRYNQIRNYHFNDKLNIWIPLTLKDNHYSFEEEDFLFVLNDLKFIKIKIQDSSYQELNTINSTSFSNILWKQVRECAFINSCKYFVYSNKLLELRFSNTECSLIEYSLGGLDQYLGISNSLNSLYFFCHLNKELKLFNFYLKKFFSINLTFNQQTPEYLHHGYIILSAFNDLILICSNMRDKDFVILQINRHGSILNYTKVKTPKITGGNMKGAQIFWSPDGNYLFYDLEKAYCREPDSSFLNIRQNNTYIKINLDFNEIKLVLFEHKRIFKKVYYSSVIQKFIILNNISINKLGTQYIVNPGHFIWLEPIDGVNYFWTIPEHYNLIKLTKVNLDGSETEITGLTKDNILDSYNSEEIIQHSFIDYNATKLQEALNKKTKARKCASLNAENEVKRIKMQLMLEPHSEDCEPNMIPPIENSNENITPKER